MQVHRVGMQPKGRRRLTAAIRHALSQPLRKLLQQAPKSEENALEDVALQQLPHRKQLKWPTAIRLLGQQLQFVTIVLCRGVVCHAGTIFWSSHAQAPYA